MLFDKSEQAERFKKKIDTDVCVFVCMCGGNRKKENKPGSITVVVLNMECLDPLEAILFNTFWRNSPEGGKK